MKLITSVSQLMEFVEMNCASGLNLFRGQRRNDPLLPKIARMPLASDFKNEEQKLMQEFKIRSNPYLNLTTPDFWDWLAIAQHNRMATRLLDWTDNPLAALWFAVEKPPDKEQHGVLWSFRVDDEDMVLSQEKENPFNCKRTKVFRPKHISKSISAQGGWFTVHKYLESKKSFVPLEKNRLYRTSLKKLHIERGSFPQLRRQLDRCGVNQSTMFPDLTGLCEYLNWRYRGKLGVPEVESFIISQIT